MDGWFCSLSCFMLFDVISHSNFCPKLFRHKRHHCFVANNCGFKVELRFHSAVIKFQSPRHVPTWRAVCTQVWSGVTTLDLPTAYIYLCAAKVFSRTALGRFTSTMRLRLA